MRKVLFLMCLFAFVFSSSAWAADVSGNWALKMTGPMGEETVDLAITAKGSDLTITGKHSSLGEIKGTGTLKDDAITMEIQATGEMAVGFAFTGKVSGNKMSGTREIKMSGGGGGASGGAGGGEGGARGGGEGGAPGGAGGGEGGAPGGAGGGEGGARGGGEGGAPGAAGGGEGGAPGGAGGEGGARSGGGGGMDMSSIPDTWTAEKK